MKADIDQFHDEKLGQIRDIQRKRIELKEFLESCCDDLSELELKINLPFGDADFELKRILLEVEKSPDLAGIGRIGNALVRYRTEALSYFSS